MPEKMPERIWAWVTQEFINMEANARRLPSDPFSVINHEKAGRWTSIESGTKKDSYLRSTPTLERAEEMRTKLRKLTIAIKKELDTSHFVKTCDCHVCKEYRKARYLLAEIEAAEGKVRDGYKNSNGNGLL